MKLKPTTGNRSSSMSKWLRYSGVSVTISLNPLWWKVLPWWRREYNEWAGPLERTWACGFLGITVRIWIDDGSW